MSDSIPIRVQHFRQILLWPLQLMPMEDSSKQPWTVLRELGAKGASPWDEVVDEYSKEGGTFHERHYNEFVTFPPYVQRFLYGEARVGKKTGGELSSPMRVFRRRDLKCVRVIAKPGDKPVTLDIVHIDLYFFLDVDIVLLNIEVSINDISLPQAQDLLHRFGRAYPAGWDKNGFGLNCLASVEWVNKQGEAMAKSDARKRELFLEHVSHNRAPRISAHWAFILQPLVSDHSEEVGVLRYRQIEYYRMPVMGYLAVDDPRALSRTDFIRLGLITGSGQINQETRSPLPYADHYLADFEQRYCYDRFWNDGGLAPNTRYLVAGHSLVVVGDARSEFFISHLRGVLAQFRHQHFMLFVIAHFQKAALLLFSNHLVDTLMKLNVNDVSSVKEFKRSIRSSFERFLRFTHRYWFHEVASQEQARALFRMCSNHLELHALYEEVKTQTGDMNDYLEVDSQRRQGNTVTRLTVVTFFGLIWTITTGFLGMNLLAEAEAPIEQRVTYFMLTLFMTTLLTAYTMVKSKRLSDYLDALSDEHISVWQKIKAISKVWTGKSFKED